jgi:hypothetical protein
MVFVLLIEDDQKLVVYETQCSLSYHHQDSEEKKERQIYYTNNTI